METLEKEVDYSFDKGLVMYTAGFTTRPLEGEPTPSELGKMPGFGKDSKGLFGTGGLFGNKVSSTSLVDIDPYKPTKDVSDLCKSFSSVSSHAISSPTMTFKMSESGKNAKIFSSDGGAPMVRLDFDDHHKMPKNHLQYGEKFFTGRHGDEAVNIFADIFTKSKKMKMF